MKQIMKQLLPPLAVALLKGARPRRDQYFALNELDKKLRKYLDYDNGFFVELGANDGVTQSNTLYFERYRNWRGVLVEPTPHNYLLCRSNRSKNSHVFCNACTSFQYKERFVEMAYSNLMSVPLGLESDIQDPLAHAIAGKGHLKDHEDNFIFGALARPLHHLLKEANAPLHIDLLSLDVEGAELEVLKGIDHSEYRFKFMCIESRSRDSLIGYLKTAGYRFKEELSGNDYLFCPIAD